MTAPRRWLCSACCDRRPVTHPDLRHFSERSKEVKKYLSPSNRWDRAIGQNKRKQARLPLLFMPDRINPKITQAFHLACSDHSTCNPANRYQSGWKPEVVAPCYHLGFATLPQSFEVLTRLLLQNPRCKFTPRVSVVQPFCAAGLCQGLDRHQFA